MISSATSHLHDPEQQQQQPQQQSPSQQGWNLHDGKDLEANNTFRRDRPLTVTTYEANTLVPAQDKLLIFRTLTGIDTVPVVAHSGHTARTAQNIGIYTRVVHHERAARRAYRLVKGISSLCLGLQIIMSAAVTALGAASGSYSGITGLGAVSTVTASIVAYIKGSGQPQKLKYAESRWKWIREYVEQRERELCLADNPLDVYHEVRVVEEMYRAVNEELNADKLPGQNQANTGAGGSPSGSGGLSGSGGGGGASGGGSGLGGGLGSALSGTTADLRRRSEAYSSQMGHEAAHKTGARPDSTMTVCRHCEKEKMEPASSVDKPVKE